MAAKYWYVAGNGSSNWNTSGVWFNGPGGTGGTTTTPTASDDAILDSASGSGTLTIAATSTCGSLRASTFTGTIAGISVLNIVSMPLTGATVLSLGGTLTYTGLITISGSATNGVILANGKTHNASITFNAPSGSFIFNDLFICRNVFTLTAGSVSGASVSVGSLSLSNSNVRRFEFTNLYFSGSGTLLSIATQTNLTWAVSNIYITNATANSKSMALSNLVYCNNIYIQGSGASSTVISSAASTGIFPNVIISKTDGTLNFGTSSFNDVTYIEGSTISWAGSSPITIYGNVTLCNSMSIITSNSLTFSGSSQTLTTFNKTFTGVLVVNGTGTFVNDFTLNGNYTSTYVGTTGILIGEVIETNFNGDIQLNNASISINTGVVAGSFVNFNNSVSTINIGVSGNNVSLGNTNLSGGLTINSGSLSIRQNSVLNINSFASSSTVNIRDIFLGIDTIINLTRTTSGSAWNTTNGIAQGVLNFNAGTSTINIIGQSDSEVTFIPGGIALYDLNINRGNGGAYNAFTGFYGSTSSSGNATFRNFRDLTKLAPGFANYILFQGGCTINIQDTFEVGNTNNLTYIYLGGTSTVSFNLVKQNQGLVICPNLRINASNASPSNTWYAISGSIDDPTNTGWIFNNIPRRLGSLGVG